MQEFERLLDKLEIYQRFPLLKPFIGKNYNKTKKRVLFIGESHYFDMEESNITDAYINKSPSKWYSSSMKDLHISKHDSINTRKIVEDSKHQFYNELEIILSKTMEKVDNKAINNIAFMNGFQRPSNKKGASFKLIASKLDFEVAIKNVTNVIEALQPDLVVFISKYAWETIGTKLYQLKNIKYEFVNHPSSIRFWHDKKYPNSKYKLIDLLK